MENYFNYFTEVEEHFQRRRGGPLIVSSVDWCLIEVWKNASIPLEAVLRGIDDAFEKYDRRPSKTKKINGLAWCSQSVLAAAEEMRTAAVGAVREVSNEGSSAFEVAEIAGFLLRNAAHLETAILPHKPGISAQVVAREIAASLREIATGLQSSKSLPNLEDTERYLTVLEEKLFASLLSATPDDDLIAVRAQADRELVPYRNKMPQAQISELLKQFTNKRLLEKYNLPRLSLFYM